MLAAMNAYDKKLPLGFISFSHADEAWMKRLKVFLKPLERHLRIELWDDSRIKHGAEWYEEIRHAMEQARVAFVLVSPDFLASDFCMMEEFPYLVERAEAGGLILLPIMVKPCSSRVLARERWLADHQSKPAPDKPLSTLSEPDCDRLLNEIVDDVDIRLDELPGRKPLSTSWPLNRCDLTRLPASGKELFGRKEELAWLDERWRTPTTNVVSLIAWGGVGKSALVNRWLEGMAKKNWNGAERIFGWSFYSQGSHENSAASADQFIDTALRWFGDSDPAAGSPWDKGERLAELIRRQRTLLVLDGLEPLQWASGDKGRIKDPALATLVENLAAKNHGLVLITSRMHVTGLEDFDRAAVPERELHSLSTAAGRALLRVRGARGWDHELEAMSEAFGNYALAVKLLAAWLREVDPPHLLKVKEIPDDLPATINARERHPRRVMAAFAQRFGESHNRQVLRLIGLFDRPATKEELAALLERPPIPALTDRLVDPTIRSEAIKTLRDAGLIARESLHAHENLDAHPLVREHFAEELRNLHQQAWSEGNKRIYQYLIGRSSKEHPRNLGDLYSLYLAIPHDCAADLHQEVYDNVYIKRIVRNDEFFSTDKLGAFGADLAAIANFFDKTWSHPAITLHEKDRISLFDFAGYRLRALGHLADAMGPFRTALDILLYRENWNYAAIVAGNLSELLIIMGRLDEAVIIAREAVKLADRSKFVKPRISNRTVLADALYLQGITDTAKDIISEAVNMPNRWTIPDPSPNILLCFRYCNILLNEKQFDLVIKVSEDTIISMKQCNASLLINPIINLSRGRAEAAIGSDMRQAEIHLEKSVEGLREVGSQYLLPYGLLVRAVFRRQCKKFEGAHRDLDEARRIAERCGMRLYLIDCDVEESFLLFDECCFEKARSLVKRARAAIAETGYHRRDPEVKELEQQLGIPPLQPSPVPS